MVTTIKRGTHFLKAKAKSTDTIIVDVEDLGECIYLNGTPNHINLNSTIVYQEKEDMRKELERISLLLRKE